MNSNKCGSQLKNDVRSSVLLCNFLVYFLLDFIEGFLSFILFVCILTYAYPWHRGNVGEDFGAFGENRIPMLMFDFYSMLGLFGNPTVCPFSWNPTRWSRVGGSFPCVACPLTFWSFCLYYKQKMNCILLLSDIAWTKIWMDKNNSLFFKIIFDPVS